MELTHGSLYSGIGGWLLSAQWAGINNVFTCEIDKFCNKVIDKNFPEIPKENRHYDIKETDFTKYAGRIDILSTSDPCQPFSFAGKRGGTTDDRFLWKETLRAAGQIGSGWFVLENVPGLANISEQVGETKVETKTIIRSDESDIYEAILSRQEKLLFGQSIQDLKEVGYELPKSKDGTPIILVVPACAIGAQHRRDRLWLVSYNEKFIQSNGETKKKRKYKGTQIENRGLHSDVPYSECEGLQGQSIGQMGKSSKLTKGSQINTDTTNTLSFDGQWDIEPNVGGRFNGLPLWLHGHIIKGYGQEESTRRTEILRELWNDNVSQTIWKVIGGFNRVQKSEVLFAFVCEYEKDSNKARLFMESEKALEGFVRSLWQQEKITGSSYRPKNRKQPGNEYPDPMQTLSRLLAHNLQENWQISSWEDGIPRVESGIKNRVNRLKSLGNSIVPQIGYIIMEAIKQAINN
ncbi:hypothetical protein LCGC14_1504230 [marine sediment metagenome]|uniref:DNA (cytosine-5-)-methyltransferase n=1 Tax=marine sediment metagenome TaxID=412755 RepID=A0A0F9M4H5_9ZZZZ